MTHFTFWSSEVGDWGITGEVTYGSEAAEANHSCLMQQHEGWWTAGGNTRGVLFLWISLRLTFRLVSFNYTLSCASPPTSCYTGCHCLTKILRHSKTTCRDHAPRYLGVDSHRVQVPPHICPLSLRSSRFIQPAAASAPFSSIPFRPIVAERRSALAG